MMRRLREGRKHGVVLAVAAAAVLGNTGCMSYTVKGGRPGGAAGPALEQRFTVTQLDTALRPGSGEGPFAAAKGICDLKSKRDELSAILCRERPDLFVASGGVPFGVAASMIGADWPGNRIGTWALYVLTLGCWPVSLDGRMRGDAYLYAQQQPERALAKGQWACGYKCNLSVFTPLGLVPGLNGFPGYDGEEVTGLVAPAPDSEKTAPVFLTEIARAIADAMTPATRAKLAAAAAPGGDRESQIGTGEASAAREGYVDVVSGAWEGGLSGRVIYYFVNSDPSRPATMTASGDARMPLAPGSYLFGTNPRGKLGTTIQVEAGRVTVLTLERAHLKGSDPMLRSDAELYKIKFWSRLPKPRPGGRASFEAEVQSAIDRGEIQAGDLQVTYPDGSTHKFKSR